MDVVHFTKHWRDEKTEGKERVGLVEGEKGKESVCGLGITIHEKETRKRRN